MLKKIKLGDLLVKHNLITSKELKVCLAKQEHTNQRLGDLLLEHNFINAENLARFLAEQLNLAFVNLTTYIFKPQIIRELCEQDIYQLQAMPIDRINEGYLVAMADPTDLVAFDKLVGILKAPIRIVVVNKFEMYKWAARVYENNHQIDNLMSAAFCALEDLSIGKNHQDLADPTTSNIPIVKLLGSIFSKAIDLQASDIHIEPHKNGLRIRFRVAGKLIEQVSYQQDIIKAIILRIKLLAKLNISESRLPQEGKFDLTKELNLPHIENKIEIRVAIAPLVNGESVVLRLLDASSELFSINNLGMSSFQKELFTKHLKQQSGMIVITGPTGAGKSTTIYAALNYLNDPANKIVSLEDPVECQLERVNQIQVRPNIGLDFKDLLPKVLRLDPDIIMIGETRDKGTANIAMSAALTGHLVLTTLHVKDAVGVPLRLMDLGVAPYLIGSVVKLIIAQKLYPKLCSHCALSRELSKYEIDILHAHYGKLDKIPQTAKEAKGCNKCHMSGFLGQIAIFELLEINEKMSKMLVENNLAEFNLLAKPNSDNLLKYLSQGKLSINTVVGMLSNEKPRGWQNAS